MREIELVGGLIATVDDEDFDRLSAHVWYAHRNKGSRTVYAKAIKDGITLYMHRLVLRAPPHMVADHIDRNGLNNTRANLRLVTLSENSRSWERDLAARGIHRVIARGRAYYYYHRGRGTAVAGKRIRLVGEPGQPEFEEHIARLNREHRL